MKIYKVEQEILTLDWGRETGEYALIGYYAKKEKAEEVAKNTKRGMTRGDVYIEEIEVEE